MHQNGVNFQLVPPHLHRTNTTERAIQTYKDHLVTGLSSCDPKLPLHIWDQLLHQATLTLNILYPSRINTRLLAESQLNRSLDFNRNPLAPPSTNVPIYKDPTNRRTWAPHGVAGWYIGSAIEHYQCYRVYMSVT